jgi:hypothetical protein
LLEDSLTPTAKYPDITEDNLTPGVRNKVIEEDGQANIIERVDIQIQQVVFKMGQGPGPTYHPSIKMRSVRDYKVELIAEVE